MMTDTEGIRGYEHVLPRAAEEVRAAIEARRPFGMRTPAGMRLQACWLERPGAPEGGIWELDIDMERKRGKAFVVAMTGACLRLCTVGEGRSDWPCFLSIGDEPDRPGLPSVWLPEGTGVRCAEEEEGG